MSAHWDYDWARLPLEGTVNTRDLGGLPAAGGRPTRYHRFLRSDELADLTEADREFLYGYGVRTVIDLRGNAEALERPDVLPGDDVAYHHISLFEVDVTQTVATAVKTIEDVYLEILGHEDRLLEVFQTIAEAEPGCILFHCAVGKDRTGVVAAILLTLAGCDHEDIAANYTQSGDHLMRTDWYREYFKHDMSEVTRGHLVPYARFIRSVLDRIERGHGSIDLFLRHLGLEDGQIAAIRSRLLDE